MDSIDKEPKPLAHILYMSKKTFFIVLVTVLTLIIIGSVYFVYKKYKKPKQTQLEKNIEAVAQKAASITTTPEEKQKMIESLKKQESFTLPPKEAKNADEDLINQFLKNQ